MRFTFAALAALVLSSPVHAQDLPSPTTATLNEFREALNSMADVTSVPEEQRTGWLAALRGLASTTPPTDFGAQNDIWGSIAILDPASAEAQIKAETFAAITGSAGPFDPSDASASTVPNDGADPVAQAARLPAAKQMTERKITSIAERIGRMVSLGNVDGARQVVAAQGPHASWPAGLADAMETAALRVVRPLPASNPGANADGYEILSLIKPDNQTYEDKAVSYREAEVEARSGVVRALKKEHDKVRGVSFFHHRNEPRYADTRSTIWLYISQSDSGGRPTLHMRGNYTSDSWLFAKSLDVYVDGRTMPFYRGEFLRDNDSEIWEWFDEVPSADQIALLRRMAASEEVILRFTGRTYYDDATIGAGDKKAISDMLAAYEEMSVE